MSHEAFDLGVTDQAAGTAATASGPESPRIRSRGQSRRMKAVVPSVPQDAENYQAFVSEFQERFGEEPTSWSAYAYDAVVVSALAIEAADEFTGSALMEVVRDVTRPEGEEATSCEDATGFSRTVVHRRRGLQRRQRPGRPRRERRPAGLLQVFEVVDHAYESSDYIDELSLPRTRDTAPNQPLPVRRQRRGVFEHHRPRGHRAVARVQHRGLRELRPRRPHDASCLRGVRRVRCFGRPCGTVSASRRVLPARAVGMALAAVVAVLTHILVYKPLDTDSIGLLITSIGVAFVYRAVRQATVGTDFLRRYRPQRTDSGAA